MSRPDQHIFIQLFREACEKCFGHPVDGVLNEPECKHLSHAIEDATGLTIGWKSIKNYSHFATNPESGRAVNPSVATLDTLSRYILDAPVTSEPQRKMQEGHFPWWYRYRDSFTAELTGMQSAPVKSKHKHRFLLVIAGVLVTILWIRHVIQSRTVFSISEPFDSVADNYLGEKGWLLRNQNATYWTQRNVSPGMLTLFTLMGDNWYQEGQRPEIQNLLLHPVEGACFNAMVQLSDFLPRENWQQAGLIFMEDTIAGSRSIRLSIAYNDFFGGYQRAPEILVQAIATSGASQSAVEEIAHYPLFVLDSTENIQRVATNLHASALKIEKDGHAFRFLYAASPVENYSFKEFARYSSDLEIRYVGVFAIKGFVENAGVIPVKVDYFRLESTRCTDQ